ncbi:PAS domain-containing sensor histidine kinase [Paenibacillus alginolyticus]|uniref:histidine kinase n=1 Tax=Paenibacillus alginolyticus TaxID=59839 RepID=A0ABT4G787_9BACL|nr:PAS domain-containing sensor histidine kinase [Paenibacillus alginolyticus]MCY9692042.1 ATP-binding protein [Paenibacillus alginolyticus]MEC0144232.1 ATP-binding protein [Paenibacillus alginolyticus]
MMILSIEEVIGTMAFFLQAFTSRLTRKYLLIFSLILIIPTIIIYRLIVSYAQNVMEEHIARDNLIGADAIVNRLNAEITNVVLQLQLIAGQNLAYQTDEKTMYENAKQTIAKSSMLHAIYYVDNESRMRFEAPFSPEMQAVSYAYPGLEHVRWSYTYMVSGLLYNYRKETAVTIAVPVYYKDRTFHGALVAELSRDYLSEMLRTMSASREGFSYLLDLNGRVIASSEEDILGKDLGSDSIGQRLMVGDSGLITSLYQGRESIVAYQQMRDNWGLALGIPKDIAFQPVQLLGRALTISFLSIFVLSLLLILFGMRGLLYPIIHLTRFANKYRQEHTLEALQADRMDAKDELSVLTGTMKALTHELDFKERFLRDVIEGIPYALVTINHEGLVTHANDKFYHLFQIHWTDPTKPHISVIPELSNMSSLQGESELTILGDRGERNIVRIVTAPFHNGVLAVLQDVTQIKLLEEHVSQSEKLAQMGQITAGVAHELKNPLAVLASSSELMKDEMMETHQDFELIRTLIYDIDEEIARMSGIVNQFLSFAKTKSEDEGLIEVDQLIERVLHLLRIKFNESKVIVNKHFEAPLPLILGRYNKLIQLFLNLFLNSIDAMPSGGLLTLSIMRKEQELEVRIEDSGEGISQNDMQWLFNPFFSTKEQGTGIGLTIASEIIREHGGEIQIESILQQGTTVICKFPIQRKEITV